jgi:hypothetical protein
MTWENVYIDWIDIPQQVVGLYMLRLRGGHSVFGEYIIMELKVYISYFLSH